MRKHVPMIVISHGRTPSGGDYFTLASSEGNEYHFARLCGVDALHVVIVTVDRHGMLKRHWRLLTETTAPRSYAEARRVADRFLEKCYA